MIAPIATKMNEVFKLYPEFSAELEALLDKKLAAAAASLSASEVEAAGRAGVALSSVVIAKRQSADRQAELRGEPIPTATALGLTNTDLHYAKLAGIPPAEYARVKKTLEAKEAAKKAEVARLRAAYPSSSTTRGTPTGF
jgi:nitrogenase molybdenum-iron protein alpha/beta subunit